MAIIEDRIKYANNEIDDILMSVGSIKMDVKVLGKDLKEMNETLKKKNSDLKIFVEEIETVKSEQENVRTIHGDIEIVRRSTERCLTLKDDINFEADRISKMNTQMEKLNEGSSFIQQEHNKFSKTLQELNAKLMNENNLLDTNTKEVTQLKETIEQLNVNSRKLDDSFVVLGTEVAYCSEQMDKCKETAETMKGIIYDETYLNKSINTLKKEVEILNTNITTINGDLIEENNLLNINSMEVAKLKVDTKQLNVNSKKLNDSFAVLGTEVANCSEQMEKCKETVERMEGIIKDETYLNSSIKMLKKEVETLTSNISSVNGTLSAESKKLNNLQLLLETVQEKHGEIIKMDAKLDETQQSVSHLEEDIIKLAEEIGKYQKEFPSISKIPVQTLNTTKEDVSSDTWLWIQRTTAVLGLITFYGVLFYKKIDVMEKQIKYLTEYKDKLSLKNRSACIVDQIKRKQPKELDNKFCVISFSQETHNKHRKITRHCVEGRRRIKNMDEADFVVTNGKSVLNIPPCKVLLVFVDHNYQDVILENPIEDNEDIKLLTVQACRKIGADVFVIYVGDEGSESLGCLYNPELTTVGVHFELKQLARRKRVISCYEKFTTTQRKKVAQAIV
ncbi:myosin heavy chain, clone 203-like [Mytilus edulis]|uniref:myosin heavy chain, clone 203-like n=1 Tax=Mytilus edulis TaxID=6550 RepID=UPI0039F0A0F1